MNASSFNHEGDAEPSGHNHSKVDAIESVWTEQMVEHVTCEVEALQGFNQGYQADSVEGYGKVHVREVHTDQEDESEGESGGESGAVGGLDGFDPLTIFGADQTLSEHDTQGAFSGHPMDDPQYKSKLEQSPPFGLSNMPNSELNPSQKYSPNPTPAESIRYLKGYQQQQNQQPQMGGPSFSPIPRPFSTGSDAIKE